MRLTPWCGMPRPKIRRGNVNGVLVCAGGTSGGNGRVLSVRRGLFFMALEGGECAMIETHTINQHTHRHAPCIEGGESDAFRAAGTGAAGQSRRLSALHHALDKPGQP